MTSLVLVVPTNAVAGSADIEAPVTTAMIRSVSAAGAVIGLTATDEEGGSGLAWLCYSVDGARYVAVNPSQTPIAWPITPSVSAPSGHSSAGTAASVASCAVCHTLICEAPTITESAVVPTVHADLACTACHVVSGTGSTGGYPPITPTVPAPAGHFADGTAQDSPVCAACHKSVTVAPSITDGAIAPVGHATIACSRCHEVYEGLRVDRATTVFVLVRGAGAHNVGYWAMDNAGNITAGRDLAVVVPAPAPVPPRLVATKVSISINHSKVKRGRTVRFSGRITPSQSKGASVVLERRRSGSSVWHKVATCTTAGSKWSRTVRMKSRGTWYYRARFKGGSGYRASTSASRKVKVR